MKKVTLILSIIALTLTTKAQSEDIKPIEFDTVLNVSDTQAELYNQVKNYILENFNGDKDKITADETNNILAFNGSFTYAPNYAYNGTGCIEGFITFKATINFKENRFKVKIKDLEHLGWCSGKNVSYGLITDDGNPPRPTYGHGTIEAWDDIYNQAIEKVNKLLKELGKGDEQANW